MIVILRLALLLVFLSAFPGQADDADTVSYTLNTGDHVQITVFEEPDLSIDAVLDDTGAISFPLLGETKVRGLTPRELEAAITEGLRGRFLINPQVNVSIREYRPFFVRGEVANPGGYPFKPGLTLEKAVSIAGGFTSRASRSEFYIMSDDAVENESGKGQPAQLKSRIRPGDVINIEQSFF
ncbi:MAG: polysaccharide export protein [Halioglobus sp.]|nr:polysaccharide export protein [Halioglobus sp.]